MTPDDTQTLLRSTGTLDTTYLGSRTSQLGVEENIGIGDDKRLLHTISIGPTGAGKTQAMLHIALQDAAKGYGFCIVNPKGAAIDELIAKLPDDRLDDIIYIDPAGEQTPAINVLEPHITPSMTQAQKEHQKEIIVADLIDLFKRQSENWGDRFGRILETLLRAHIDLNITNSEANTLLDVFQCVVTQDHLTDLIDRTDDPVIREQLVRIKKDMGSYELEPLQRRLNDFMMNPTIRNIIAAESSGVDFRDALDQGHIVLVDIQKGEVGETVSQLVGSIIITQIWAATQSRITQPVAQRTPFFLYIDELQNFAGEGSNIDKILSEAREYRLGCYFATQYLDRLPTSMRQAVINNCRTKIAFSPGDSDDTSKISRLFNGLDKDQLAALGDYRAAVQHPAEGQRNNAVILDTYPPWDAEHTDRVETIKTKHAATGTPGASYSASHQTLGAGANAGGETHADLLQQVKTRLEDQGMQVTLLYQDTGDDKPDGHVHLPTGDIAHLEAEHSTLTKPAAVLTNLSRAVDAGHECIFAVEEGKAVKLQNIVTDPVNRRGDDHEDDHGSYSHYTQEDGQPFTDTDELADAEYRIIEIGEDELEIHADTIAPECPLLGDYSRDELETFCPQRDDDTGYCAELGQDCVITDP